jgi:very-short-patch-repair endonuclease
MGAKKKQPKRSVLEIRFAYIWGIMDGPKLVEELAFHPKRKWRFDFAHPATKTAIEIEGGVWSGGRHTKPAGFTRDCEKYNAAAAAGWTVFRLTGYHINEEHIDPIKKFILCQTNTPSTARPN